MTLLFFCIGALIVGFLANWISNIFSKEKTTFSLGEKFLLGVVSSIAGTFVGYLIGTSGVGIVGTILLGIILIWGYKKYVLSK